MPGVHAYFPNTPSIPIPILPFLTFSRGTESHPLGVQACSPTSWGHLSNQSRNRVTPSRSASLWPDVMGTYKQPNESQWRALRGAVLKLGRENQRRTRPLDRLEAQHVEDLLDNRRQAWLLAYGRIVLSPPTGFEPGPPQGMELSVIGPTHRTT